MVLLHENDSTDKACVHMLIRYNDHPPSKNCILLKPDAVKSLRKVPEKETPDSDRKGSTDSEADDLSFTEKKTYFQRLSLESDNIPGSTKYIQDVSLDDLPMAEGEIIEEQISFEDKMKMFEPDVDNRKKIQKRDKQEQPTVYRYDFTKNGKERMDATEYAVSELEKAEEIVRQVSDELIEEESRLSNRDGSTDSAITLERVEQEVYSLIAEVDREEKKLSKEDAYDSENENVGSESEADHQERSLVEEDMQEESMVSRQSFEQDTFASELEVEGEEKHLYCSLRIIYTFYSYDYCVLFSFFKRICY